MARPLRGDGDRPWPLKKKLFLKLEKKKFPQKMWPLSSRREGVCKAGPLKELYFFSGFPKGNASTNVSRLSVRQTFPAGKKHFYASDVQYTFYTITNIHV